MSAGDITGSQAMPGFLQGAVWPSKFKRLENCLGPIPLPICARMNRFEEGKIGLVLRIGGRSLRFCCDVCGFAGIIETCQNLCMGGRNIGVSAVFLACFSIVAGEVFFASAKPQLR